MDTLTDRFVTDEEVARRHRLSIGKNFEAHVARSLAKSSGGGVKNKPVWQRLIDIAIPFTLMIGRQDRGRSLERAELLMQEYPDLDIRIVEDCKHMISWDAAKEVELVAISMIAGNADA